MKHMNRARLTAMMSVIALGLCRAWSAEGAVTPSPAKAYALPHDFVSVYEGHLYQDGKRVRFWSMAGPGPASAGIAAADSAEVRQKKIAAAHAYNEHMVRRMQDMGINMVRLWSSPVAWSVPASEEKSVAKDDGSDTEMLDHFLYSMKTNGMKVWFASFGNSTGSAKPEDAAIVNDAATAEAWQQAIAEMKGPNIRGCIARHWDPRLEALYIRDIKRNADHVSPYTGLRYADDPLFAVWELTNEEWWMSHMVGGQWQTLPTFFRKELIGKWHGFLKTKYGDEKALVKAWGFLMPGESLEQGTVLLAPMRDANKPVKLNDANPQAEAVFKGVEQTVGRRDFTPARGSDVLEFLVGLQIGHKQRVYAQVKKWGRSCALAPVIFDTGIGYEAQAQYMHQQADAVAHCAYIHGTSGDKTYKRYPFISGLEEPPRICYDVPWLEHNKVEGKPYFCYEAQIGQPAKYRAEFPWRLVALGTIQDWDIISWHFYNSRVADLSKPNPYDVALSFPGEGAYQFHMVMDEVQMSAMRAASAVFRGLLMKPAPTPTTFIWGRKTLYDPASMDYAGSYGAMGWNMLPTTYRYGARVLIDPSREDDAVIGPVVKLNSWAAPNPIKPTDQLTFDWSKGNLVFDAPGAAMFVGFLAQYGDKVAFSNGVALSEVTIRNAAGIPYPVTDAEKYISFCVTSEDGQPLASAKKALISLVSTSFNTGLDVPAGKWGSLPVLYARVGGTVTAPALTGMRYTLRDWHMREIGKGVVKDGRLAIAAEQPVFVVELER